MQTNTQSTKGEDPQQTTDESALRDAACSALQNLQADPRYIETWKAIIQRRDVEPMKALYGEYGVTWITLDSLESGKLS